MEQLINIKHGLLVTCAILLMACGGGDSAVPAAAPAGVSYTGNGGQAALTADNDDSYGITMVEGSTTSKNSNPFAAVGVDSDARYSKQHLSLMDELAKRFQQDIKSAGTHTQRSTSIGAAGIDQGGSCGGSVTFGGTESAGSVTYNHYCVGTSEFNITLNGSMSFTSESLGAYDYRMTVSYTDFSISVTDGADSWTQTVSGSLTILSQGGQVSVTYSNLFEREGKVYKLENLSLTDGEISGRLYHPDYGYVDISTDPADRFFIYNNQYCGGSLIITGVDATGSEVISRMSVSDDCTSYTISYGDSGASETVAW